MLSVQASALIQLALQGTDTPDLGTATDKLNIQRGRSMVHGSGADEANMFFHETMAITTLDEVQLNDGSLLDAFGVGMVLTALKILFIKNLTGGALTIGAAAAPLVIFGTPATDTIVLADDCELLMIFDGTGLAIDNTKDSIEFVHAIGGAQSVEMLVAGTG